MCHCTQSTAPTAACRALRVCTLLFCWCSAFVQLLIYSRTDSLAALLCFLSPQRKSLYITYKLKRTKECVLNAREKKTWPFSKWFFFAVCLLLLLWLVCYCRWYCCYSSSCCLMHCESLIFIRANWCNGNAMATIMATAAVCVCFRWEKSLCWSNRQIYITSYDIITSRQPTNFHLTHFGNIDLSQVCQAQPQHTRFFLRFLRLFLQLAQRASDYT